MTENNPPPIESVMEKMRKMLEELGTFNPVIMTSEEGLRMISCDQLPPHEMLDLLLLMKKLGSLDLDWAVVVSDSYYLHDDAKPKFSEPMRRGLLQELFEKGDPRVKEALMVSCYGKTKGFAATQPYTRDGDKFIYDEVIDMTEQLGKLDGDLPVKMKELVGYVPS
jgi:hypothetical protein